MRERVEDLGKIAVMIKHLLGDYLFEERPFRNKEFLDWVEGKSKKRDEYLHFLPYQIDAVRDKLFEVLEIAEGLDILNQPPDGR